MNRPRVPVLELLALGVLLWYTFKAEDTARLALELHRASFLACQQIARGFGSLAIQLEKSYRLKVAP
jgi:hypothetical protein